MDLMISHRDFHEAVRAADEAIFDLAVYYAGVDPYFSFHKQDLGPHSSYEIMIARDIFHKKMCGRFGNNKETLASEIVNASLDLSASFDHNENDKINNGYGKMMINQFTDYLTSNVFGYLQIKHSQTMAAFSFSCPVVIAANQFKIYNS